METDMTSVCYQSLLRSIKLRSKALVRHDHLLLKYYPEGVDGESSVEFIFPSRRIFSIMKKRI